MAARRSYPGVKPGRGSAILIPGMRLLGKLLRLSRKCLKSEEVPERRAAATSHSGVNISYFKLRKLIFNA